MTDAAALYDLMNGWGPSDDFHLGLVLAAASVLDVGCGTGMLLHRARDAGHGGRLVGLDPDPVMLARARRRADIEWVPGTAADAAWDGEFELAVMAGHAFQFLATDEELRASLAAIRAALVPGGRFTFETRNPALRAWERWAEAEPFAVTGPSGAVFRVSYEVEFADGIVHTREITTGGDLAESLVGEARLRFCDRDELAGFLDAAGFAVDEQFGSWDRSPCTPSSPEIITVARKR